MSSRIRRCLGGYEGGEEETKARSVKGYKVVYLRWSLWTSIFTSEALVLPRLPLLVVPLPLRGTNWMSKCERRPPSNTKARIVGGALA